VATKLPRSLAPSSVDQLRQGTLVWTPGMRQADGSPLAFSSWSKSLLLAAARFFESFYRTVRLSSRLRAMQRPMVATVNARSGQAQASRGEPSFGSVFSIGSHTRCREGGAVFAPHEPNLAT